MQITKPNPPHRRPASGRPGRGPAGHGQRGPGRYPGSAGQKPLQPRLARSAQEPRDENAVRFVPLGGLEEVGRNCSFFEYRDEIIIIDVGIQFPEETTPGIDFIIPNIAYLEQNRHKIRAILLTHGHFDHIAAIHYVIEKIGNPLIYTADFTKAVVERRHAEFVNAPKLRFDVVKHGDKRKLGEHFQAEFFNVDHTIPDALGFLLATPVGNMVSFGDFRLKVDRNNQPIETEIFAEIGKRGIHSIFLDSTNSLKEGFSSSEMNVEDNLDKLVTQAPGRVIVATFSSLLTRVFEIVKLAEKHGRKVAVNGRSMRDNLTIAQQLGYFKPPKNLMITMEELNKHKDEKVLVLTTGAQGEPNAGLMRIVNGEHPLMKLKKTDTVIFSSSVIPGNERTVQALQDNISRQVDEVYNTKILDIHTSGHAHREDLKLVIQLTKPQYIFPIHAYYFMRKSLVKIAKEVGVPRERVVILDNGDVGLLTPGKVAVSQEKVPASYVMVDGLGVGDVEEIVLRDRRSLAAEGMVVVIVTMGQHNRLLKNPDIISRGFIFLKEHGEILDEIRKRIKNIVGRLPGDQEVQTDYVKTLIRDQIGQFLYTKTKRRPMILPVIIEI